MPNPSKKKKNKNAQTVKIVAGAASLALCLWLGFLMTWNTIVTSLMFFPEKTFYEKPQDYGYAFEDVGLATHDGVRLHGWFLKASGAERGALLFFHGNAGNISNRLFKMRGWIDRGFSVFLVDYRGYGKSEGKIHEQQDILADAQAAFQWMTEAQKFSVSRIILYGESLGTHPAIRLGAEHKAAAVILEAPFTSFLKLARIHYPFVPEVLIRDFEFSNEKYIPALKAPLFILHGTQDEICPYEMAGELFEKAPNPKDFFSVPHGQHNDLPVAAGEDFWERPFQFVSRYLKP